MRLSIALLIILLACSSLLAITIVPVMGQASYAVTITLQGLPATMNTTVFVDGAPNITLDGGQSRSFNFSGSSSHYIVVQSFVPSFNGQNGTRYHEGETSWSFSTGGSHVFTYSVQYYLKVQTFYSTASGEGWYDAGSVAMATLSSGEVDEGQDTRQIFAGWSIDASGAGLTSNGITMNEPKTANATWKTQFYLNVSSDPPGVKQVTGSGWYGSGDSANISSVEVIQTAESIRLRFDHWSGAFDGQSPTGMIVMDRPKSVMAHYVSQYLLTVQYDPASIESNYNETHAGWYDANANVQIGPPPPIINLSTVERLQFSGWAENATLNTTPSIIVLINNPQTITLSYKTQYYVAVQSQYGAVSGSGWYEKGSLATISVSSTGGTWPFIYNFAGWTIEPSTGNLNRSGSSWNLLVTQPYVLQASWKADYVPIITMVGGVVAVTMGLVALVLIGRRRGLFTRGRGTQTLRTTGRASPCKRCGNLLPEGALFCEKCGNSVESIPGLGIVEDRVYDYVVKNEGVISLSKASSDLGISVEELKRITEKLKKEGRLS